MKGKGGLQLKVLDRKRQTLSDLLQERERERKCVIQCVRFSVTRFGKISPFWKKN